VFSNFSYPPWDIDQDAKIHPRILTKMRTIHPGILTKMQNSTLVY
jgi:hypothetical protein